MFEFIQTFLDSIEESKPVIKTAASRADNLGCAIIETLHDIRDSLDNATPYTKQKLVPIAVTNSPQTIEVPLVEQWSFKGIVVPVATEIQILVGGLPIFDKAFTAADTHYPAGNINLERGTELTIQSIGANATITLIVEVVSPKPKKFLRIGNKEPSSMVNEGTAPNIEPDRHFTDEAIIPPIVNPDQLEVDLEPVGTRTEPFPPYDG